MDRDKGCERMTTEEAKEIIIKERDSLKANPMLKVEDCLYDAFDLAIKALETYRAHEEFMEYMKNNPVDGYKGDNHNW